MIQVVRHPLHHHALSASILTGYIPLLRSEQKMLLFCGTAECGLAQLNRLQPHSPCKDSMSTSSAWVPSPYSAGEEEVPSWSWPSTRRALCPAARTLMQGGDQANPMSQLSREEKSVGAQRSPRLETQVRVLEKISLERLGERRPCGP